MINPTIALLGGLALAGGSYFAVRLLRPFLQSLSTARQKSAAETAKTNLQEQGAALQTEIDKLSAIDQ